MTTVLPQLKTFDEFIAWYPEQSEYSYELHNGVIVEVPKPTGKHSEIGGFLALELGLLFRQQKSPYLIPKECLIKSADQTGYEPDVIVLKRDFLALETCWQRESVITQGATVTLAIEIVSTNWRDDYGWKVNDYETLGIQEVWLVDYQGLGGIRYIGSPKQPVISIYSLTDSLTDNLTGGEYIVNQFRGSELLRSPSFPELNLTANQIFQAGII